MGFENWTALFTVALFMGLMVVLILVFSRERKSTDLLLAAYMGCLMMFTFHSLLIEWDLIEKVPQFFRFPRPLMYSLGPLLYLYLRRMAYQEIRFRRWDFFLFLPTLLQFILQIPFFLMPAEEKRAIIRMFKSGHINAFLQSEAFIPTYIQPFLIEGWSLFFLGLSVQLIISLRRQKNRFHDYQNRLQIRWLTLLVSINILQFLLMGIQWFARTSVVQNFRFITIEVAIILLLVSITLFFHPHILYGFKGAVPMLQPEEEEESESETDKDGVSAGYVLSPERRIDILQQVHLMMEERKVFLQKGYSIRHLGQDTGLPFNYLSQVINQEYGMNFNELINKHRIRYFKELYADPENKGFTLEALAEKAGFSSRATFARSFMRVEGMTPREFVKQN